MTISHKQQAFINEYLINGHNATQAYKKAYPNTKNGWHAHGSRLIAKDKIKAEINRKIAILGVKAEHNRAIAIKELRYSIELYDKIIKQGEESEKLGLPYVQAIKGRNEAIKELNAISNLHSNTVHTAIDKPAELTESEQKEALEASNRVLNVKLG